MGPESGREAFLKTSEEKKRKVQKSTPLPHFLLILLAPGAPKEAQDGPKMGSSSAKSGSGSELGSKMELKTDVRAILGDVRAILGRLGADLGPEEGDKGEKVSLGTSEL